MSPVDKQITLKYKSEIIGKALVRKYSDGLNFLTDFVIYPQYQGQGLGQKALTYLINNYNVNGLTVGINNKKAMHIYKKFGFEIKGDAYFDKDANETVYYMVTPDSPDYKE